MTVPFARARAMFSESVRYFLKVFLQEGILKVSTHFKEKYLKKLFCNVNLVTFSEKTDS